ncbi:MAG: T9SS type A sorting domain-containing protein [Bacteroidetes bacterium]|nr:T9SS type A sorting domain-containing protein [Bacteroidota bacterium]
MFSSGFYIRIACYPILILFFLPLFLPAQAITDSLAAFYPFNGNTNDNSGNGHDAVYIDASLTMDRFGKDSSAYIFDGKYNTIQFGDILDNIFCAPNAKFSINGWAKTRKCGSFITGGGLIMSKSAGGPTGPYQWNISHQDGLVCAAVISDGIGQNLLWLSNPVPINEWFQFTLVFDGSLPELDRLKLYINGDTNKTSIYKHLGMLGSSTLNSSQSICIGASHEYAHPQYLHSFYDGVVDDIGIYAKALTKEEINILYHESGWDTTNHQPVANAGPDQIVYLDSTSGALATLNASSSFDADLDSLTYTWIESDTLLTTGINPSILLPTGIHNISLIVDDSKGGLDTDMVVIDIHYLPNGLIAYYPFSGNADDSSGNGYGSTFVNAPFTSDRFGKESSAFSFNGSSNTIQYGDILDEVFCAPIAKFTITGWAKTRTSGSFTYGAGSILGKNGTGNYGSYQWNISHVEGFLYGAVFSDTLSENYIALITPAPLNQWYQFALVFDGTLPEMQRVKLYYNGDISRTSVYQHIGTLGTSITENEQYLTVGASHLTNSPQIPNHFYNGDIDDIRIYAKALNQEEIDSLHHENGWSTINSTPAANAGPDQVIYTDSTSGALVALDASLSSDADLDTLTYTWKESDTLLTAGINPSIVLPIGIHNILLIVDDSKGGLDTDIVVINVHYLENGLAAYYPFSGNADDSSSNGYNAVYINASLTKDRFGKDSSAYSFNGFSNTIQFGDILDGVFCAPVAKFTITGWAKTRNYGSFSSGGGLIMSKSAGGSGPYQWNISHQEGLVTATVLSNGDASNYIWLSNPVTKNVWFQFAVVFDGSLSEAERLKLYIDGSLSNTSIHSQLGIIGTTTLNSTQSICVGASHEYGNTSAFHSYYDGIIDDIRIYAKALTNDEIDSLYNETVLTNVTGKTNLVPKKFSLYQNYPNPFNPSTTIIYELPMSTMLEIKVYNSIGQEVMVLKNKFENAGVHEVTFENSNLSSGIYFYKMKAGSFTSTKKMLLIK